MPFIYRNLAISPDDSEDMLPSLVASRLGLDLNRLMDFRILRKGIDARRKPRIKIVYTVSFQTSETDALRSRLGGDPALAWQHESLPTLLIPIQTQCRIIITGSGPAGLFAALRLAEYGLTATIIERGQPIEQRALDVQQFWRSGQLDPESNVQFGEGGAGTFSDGKLTCRSKDPLVPWVLERLVNFGAPQDILYLAKPHIGTDRLRHVVVAIRRYLMEKGFNIRFGCRLTDIYKCEGHIGGIVVNESEELQCNLLILAAGHSARDTYELLELRKVPLQPKPFAIGLRVEHPQELIDSIQYGGIRHPFLPPADYVLTWNNSVSGRSAYSFCMCPGGVVIAGSSEAGGVVTNGMSGQNRNSHFANSALVVNVNESDFGGSDPLAGIRFQRHWEHQSFLAGGCNYHAPAQNLLKFMRLPGSGKVQATYRPGILEADLDNVLPEFISNTLREGISDFGRKLRGFISSESTLIGIESRTSAPVRILRNEHYESLGMGGLYPTGEGAGYSGGIMSSAIDGIKIADTIAARLGM